MALKTLGASLQDTWQELWNILIVHLLFLLGNLLIVPGPPATVALFYYANQIVHGEAADFRDFLQAMRSYWVPAWRWGLANLLVIGLLAGDYALTGNLAAGAQALPYLQGLYLTLLASWLSFQIFSLPFLFEQDQPSVRQAWRNGLVFTGKNLGYVLGLITLLVLLLAAGTLTFMLTFVFGGAVVAFTSTRAILERLPSRP